MMKIKKDAKGKIITVMDLKKEETEVMNSFLGYIRKHQDNVIGVESYGDESEFYDEDGCVLFTTRPNEEQNGLVFMFPEAEEEFLFLSMDMQTLDHIKEA